MIFNGTIVEHITVTLRHSHPITVRRELGQVSTQSVTGERCFHMQPEQMPQDKENEGPPTASAAVVFDGIMSEFCL